MSNFDTCPCCQWMTAKTIQEEAFPVLQHMDISPVILVTREKYEMHRFPYNSCIFNKVLDFTHTKTLLRKLTQSL